MLVSRTAVVLSALAALVLTVGGFFVGRLSAPSSSSAQRPAAASGTFEPATGSSPRSPSSTPPTAPPPAQDSGGRAGTLRPDRPTPTVAAAGECLDAIAPLRKVIASTPTGATLDPTVNEMVTASLSEIDAACRPRTAQRFRTVELEPWLHYRVESSDQTPATAPATTPPPSP